MAKRKSTKVQTINSNLKLYTENDRLSKRTLQKGGMPSGASEGKACPVPLVVPVVLLLNDTNISIVHTT